MLMLPLFHMPAFILFCLLSNNIYIKDKGSETLCLLWKHTLHGVIINTPYCPSLCLYTMYIILTEYWIYASVIYAYLTIMSICLYIALTSYHGYAYLYVCTLYSVIVLLVSAPLPLPPQLLPPLSVEMRRNQRHVIFFMHYICLTVADDSHWPTGNCFSNIVLLVLHYCCRVGCCVVTEMALFGYIYVCVCNMCVCVCIFYICMYVCICILYVYICIYIYTMYMYCMGVCICVRMYVYGCVYIYVYMCVYMHIYYGYMYLCAIYIYLSLCMHLKCFCQIVILMVVLAVVYYFGFVTSYLNFVFVAVG